MTIYEYIYFKTEEPDLVTKIFDILKLDKSFPKDNNGYFVMNTKNRKVSLI